MEENKFKKRILLHTCCAPCATYVFEKLSDEGYEPSSFFYNPNIHPQTEYDKRLDELIKYCKLREIQLSIKDADTQNWFGAIKGLEAEPEGGARCFICYKLRMEEAAKLAKEKGFDCFSTVLSISPHKKADVINKIGKELELQYGIEFLEANFKKQDGFKKSLELSKHYKLFRQDYCGCVYSIRTHSE